MIVLIMAILGATAERLDGAQTLREFDFGRRPDGDFILPDGWTRVIQPGYPFFVDVALTAEEAATADRSLVFRLNGGHCAMFSPPMPASDRFNYVVQGQIKTDGLEHDQAFLLLEFLDARQRVVGEQHLSPRVGGTNDWQTVRIGPTTAPGSDVRFLRIACFSQHSDQMDLEGSVFFDDLWVGTLPRMNVSGSSPYRLFESGDPKQVQLTVTGLGGRQVNARFDLSDEERRPIGRHSAFLTEDDTGAGTVEWELPIDEVGFFNLDVSLIEDEQQILADAFPVTVIRGVTPPQPDFAISAPATPISLDHLERLVVRSGSRWLKLPLWDEAGGRYRSERGTELAMFLERLVERGHAVAGGMEKAPEDLLQEMPRRSLAVADTFRLPREAWSGEIETLLALHGLKITRWQVGADRDSSFEGAPDPEGILRAIRTEMETFGREVRLGTAWSWHVPPPEGDAIDFLSLTDAAPFGLESALPVQSAPLSAERLLTALEGVRRHYGQPTLAPADAIQTEATDAADAPPTPIDAPEIWVQTAPVSQAKYGRRQQVRDLFSRITAAKQGGADVIVLTSENSTTGGFYDDLGAPTEIFTVWRTAAEYLGGRRYAGELPAVGVENRVFTDGSSATLVLWADSPTSVRLVTGSSTVQTDLWGRQTPLARDRIAHEIAVDDMPILLTGCNEALLRIQMGARFERGWISSEIGRHSDRLLLANPFPFTLTGTVAVRFPPEWRARPETVNLQLQPGATLAVPIQFDIPQGLAQGIRDVPLEFDIAADEEYRFEIARPYRLGLDEIDVAAQTRLLADGTLEVRVALINLLDRSISLRCLLRAFDRNVFVGEPIVDLGSNEPATRTFLIPDGDDLIGRDLRLELHQIGGLRQFNIEIPVR